jgi:hypothetical protein
VFIPDFLQISFGTDVRPSMLIENGANYRIEEGGVLSQSLKNQLKNQVHVDTISIVLRLIRNDLF